MRQAKPEFISPDLRSPNGPDLKLADYRIWRRLQLGVLRLEGFLRVYLSMYVLT